jgi:hypothetical protein
VSQTLSDAALLLGFHLEGRPLTADDREQAADVIEKLETIRDALASCPMPSSTRGAFCITPALTVVLGWRGFLPRLVGVERPVQRGAYPRRLRSRYIACQGTWRMVLAVVRVGTIWRQPERLPDLSTISQHILAKET